MESNSKIKQIQGLFITCGGAIGLLFYILYPFEFLYDSERVLIDISIVSSAAFMVLGTFLFILAKKLPTLQKSPFLTIILCSAGTFELIIFIINPQTMSLMFVLGIVFWATALPYIWLICKKT